MVIAVRFRNDVAVIFFGNGSLVSEDIVVIVFAPRAIVPYGNGGDTQAA